MAKNVIPGNDALVVADNGQLQVANGVKAKNSADQSSSKVFATDGTVISLGAAGVTGSGTSGKLTKWTGSSAVGDATNTDAEVSGHLSATTAIHGLPSSVAPLGNRTASGKFVQHTTVGITLGSSAASLQYSASANVTFAVAFSGTPIVLTGGITENVDALAFLTIRNISTTGFSCRALSGAVTNSVNFGWVALGS